MSRPLRVLLNTYPWVVLRRNRELRVHEDLLAMERQFPDLSFSRVSHPLSVATGNLVLALHNLAGRLGLDRLFTSSFTYYASRSLNVVPARHVRAQDCDVLFAHEYFPLNLDAETIPIIYETQLLPEPQLAAYGQGPGSRERELRLKRLCAARATVVCVRDPTAAGLARTWSCPPPYLCASPPGICPIWSRRRSRSRSTPAAAGSAACSSWATTHGGRGCRPCSKRSHGSSHTPGGRCR